MRAQLRALCAGVSRHGDRGAASGSRLGGRRTLRALQPGLHREIMVPAMNADDFSIMRQRMLAAIAADTIYVSARIGKAALAGRVMETMGKVPRHEFVPAEIQGYAYANVPLPIGFDKTISQPFIVALMTDLLDPRETDKVLEIGTGLGYQAAILAELVDSVYSVEYIEELADQAEHRIRRQGYRNIFVKRGNGYHGWPEHAPFDKIILTTAPELIPPPLLQQLKPGGRMVLPAGLADAQQLLVIDKAADGSMTSREVLPVRFSEMEGTEAAPFGGS
jgi:protein-L-isoaspartate(D-aspartate) O-methyltransferase